MDSSTITQVSWTYQGEDITLLHDSENKKWTYKEDEAFPVDDTYPQSMLSCLASITADRKISDVTDFGQYGLDDPDTSITVTDSNGSSVKFSIGDQSTSTSGYYFRVNDESIVYLIKATLPEAFFHKLNDMVAMEDIPYIDNINKITVQTNGKTNMLVNLDEEERAKYSYTDLYAWYYEQSENSYLPVDGDGAESIVTAASGISWNSCADYNAEDKELEAYGLKNPYATVTVDYKETASSEGTTKETPCTFKLLIGNSNDSYYYAKLPDSRMVYLIPSDTVETLLNTDYAALRTNDVCQMVWDTVDSMDVTIDGKTAVIAFNRTEGSSEESSTTTTTTTYTIDGKEADSDAVGDFLSAIKGLKADDKTNNGTYSEKGDVVIVFHRNTDTFKTMTMAFSQYDSSFYLLSFNGEARLLINKNDVSSLISSFNSISK